MKGRFDLIEQYIKFVQKSASRVKNTAIAIKDRGEAAAQNRAELQRNIKALHEVYAVQSEALAASNRELAEAIKLLSEEKRAESAPPLADVFDSAIGRIETLCGAFENMGKAMEGSYQKASDFINANKPTLNAINKLADELAQMRIALTTHTPPVEAAAIESITRVCDTLENNVSGAWTNINDTLTRNAQELSATYEHFFALCKTITENADEGGAKK